MKDFIQGYSVNFLDHHHLSNSNEAYHYFWEMMVIIRKDYSPDVVYEVTKAVKQTHQ